MSYVSQQRPVGGSTCLQGQRDYGGYMARSAYDPLAFSYGRSSPCQAAAAGAQYQLNGQYGVPPVPGVAGVPGVPGVPTTSATVSSHGTGSGKSLQMRCVFM